MRIVQDASSHPEASGPLHPELQFARCMSNRYKNEQFPRCVSCTRRWAGDTCRFQGIRFFLKDNNRNIVGISFVENQKPDAPTMTFPAVWNVPLQAVHIRRTKVHLSIKTVVGLFLIKRNFSEPLLMRYCPLSNKNLSIFVLRKLSGGPERMKCVQLVVGFCGLLCYRATD
jgi:hypothetical protein